MVLAMRPVLLASYFSHREAAKEVQANLIRCFRSVIKLFGDTSGSPFGADDDRLGVIADTGLSFKDMNKLRRGTTAAELPLLCGVLSLLKYSKNRPCVEFLF